MFYNCIHSVQYSLVLYYLLLLLVCMLSFACVCVCVCVLGQGRTTGFIYFVMSLISIGIFVVE